MRLTSLPVSQETPFDLPGVNLPLTFTPMPENLLPNALDSSDIQYGRAGYVFTVRELLLMRLIETITDKPDWERMVFDEEIIAKWRDEISQSTEHATPKMIDWVIKEAQWKAEKYKEVGIIKSFDPGVVKSDVIIPEDLRRALQDAVQPLEDIPLHEKDYRPNSDNKVVDLVDPSLFPVIYGRTRVLRDHLIGLDNCLDSVGQCWKTKEPATGLGLRRHDQEMPQPYSVKFQWLPCDVKFDSGECRIVTYINNLHPVKHRNLYHVIEKILTRAISLWETGLSKKKVLPYRIPYHIVEYFPRDEAEPEPADDDRETSRNGFWKRHDQWEASLGVKLPEPGNFVPPPEISPDDQVALQTKFAEKGLQVIVQLANIELTPEKPNYGGGSWHIEGLLNERICATAIYYYDSENITESKISFRHRPNFEYIQEISYEQGQHQFLSEIFGFDQALSETEGPATQSLGSVSCRQGRLITFPNTLQHCVSPFSLADHSKPGHRKILALFLVDPNLRVISTANVPPQRGDWCKEREDLIQGVLGKHLPVELQDIVRQDLDFKPITIEEAKEYRSELIAERSIKAKALSSQFEIGKFELF